MPIKTIFTSEDFTQELEVFSTTEEKIIITIKETHNDALIELDKETAKLFLQEFARELNNI